MGAAMGWTSQEVKAASMWEFFAAWHGYVEANTPQDKAKLTEREAEELFAWIEARQRRPVSPFYPNILARRGPVGPGWRGDIRGSIAWRQT
jgi:hypothetical protein